MQTTHISKTRRIQRLVTKFLKSKGIKATNKSAKSSLGWITQVEKVRLKSRDVQYLFSSRTTTKVITVRSNG